MHLWQLKRRKTKQTFQQQCFGWSTEDDWWQQRWRIRRCTTTRQSARHSWFSLLHIQLIPPSHTRNDFCDLSPFRLFKTHDKIFVGFNIVCRGPLKVIIYTNSHLLIVAMSHLRTFCHQIHHPAKINNPNPSLQAFSTHSDSVQNGFFTFLLVRHKKTFKATSLGAGQQIYYWNRYIVSWEKSFPRECEKGHENIWSMSKVCIERRVSRDIGSLGRSCLVWFCSQLHWYSSTKYLAVIENLLSHFVTW